MSRKYLITGGAGFIGTNYVSRLLARDEQVTIYDNLSRIGGPKNIDWLKEIYGEDSFQLIMGDLRDASLLSSAAHEADVIIHLAGQVAVTTSVQHPRQDFEDNAVGTFNVLEAARLSGSTVRAFFISPEQNSSRGSRNWWIGCKRIGTCLND